MLAFAGRTALVTGGTRGIGRAIASQLRAGGAEVVVVASQLPSSDEKITGVQYRAADFSQAPQVEQLAAHLAQEKIDILINNAGINKIASGAEIDMVDWDRIQAINLRTPTVLCKAVVGGMAQRKYGRIVNLTSVFGVVSKAKRSSYSISKFGLLGLTKALALDYAESGVLVNAVAPGFIDTELTRTILTAQQIEELVKAVPMRRLGTTEEVAKTVCFLASADNSFITGQNLIIDGGFTCA